MTSRKSSLILLSGLLIGITLGLAWITTRDPVSQTQWDRIRLGMSREQVTAILGNPDGIDGPTQIEYKRAFNAGWVEFTFDDMGRLIEKNDESVFVSLDRRTEEAEQGGRGDGDKPPN